MNSPPAQRRAALCVVHASGEALLDKLNDILDLAKIEAGKLEFEEIEFDLEEVARGAHQAFTAEANKKGLSFALDIEGAQERLSRRPNPASPDPLQPGLQRAQVHRYRRDPRDGAVAG